MKNGDRELPDALDFFKYARSEKTKSTPSPSKTDATSASSKAKPKYNASDEEEGSDQASDSDSSSRANRKRKRASMDEGTDGKTSAPALRKRHRVTTKGTRVPASTETFAEMEERYQMPKILRKNLEGCGYEIPTGIQSVGVPIVLEVRLCLSFGQEEGLIGLDLGTRSGCNLAYWYREDHGVPSPCLFLTWSACCEERRR